MFRKMFRKNFYFILALLFLVNISQAVAADRYVVCGSDEDGCTRVGGLKYCACIPYNEQYGATPYCLDFDNMTCAPLSQKPDCDKNLTYPNQESCLATIFQSEPEPPCKIKPAQFCTNNKMYICDESGNPRSCHAPA